MKLHRLLDSQPFFMILYIINFSDASPPIINSRISVGKAAYEGQFPYAVRIFYELDEDKLSTCGGSLITPTAVITAAHCFDYDSIVDAELVTVLVGQTWSEITNKSSIYPSKNVIMHSKFFQNRYQGAHYDIAIVTLAKPVLFTPNVKTVKIGLGPLEPGTVGLVCGWGDRFEEDDVKVDRKLLYAVISIVDVDECKRAYPAAVKILPKDEIICGLGLEGPLIGPCEGDSGGPLTVKGHLVGYVSYAIQGCQTGYPVVYTHVSGYMNWIRKYAPGVEFVTL